MSKQVLTRNNDIFSPFVTECFESKLSVPINDEIFLFDRFDDFENINFYRFSFILFLRYCTLGH